MTSTFQVNSLGALALYQACHELLKKSNNPKFTPISSAAGTISGMEKAGSHVAPAYCVSKAALNWITLAAHCGNPWLTAVAVNPGLVATEMGNYTAGWLGLEKAPWTPDESAEKIMKLVDDATREEHSGNFLDAIAGRQFNW
ncbi:hypothetical protein F4780DRAFT_779953 [Xylariomycetidae sp. FL0641]|nr:hypothetical protein F4780DRAFT_779953 [Xylariomycetidae sp. FL0641]